MKSTMSKADTRRTLAKLEEAFPEAKCKLTFTTPFQLLVATMLAGQSMEERVNQVTVRLFQKYPDVAAFASVSSDELQEDIQELGIFRAKADHIVGAAKMILDWHKGEVPTTQEELVRLPGVGRKTANLVLANGLGIPALAVETHVQRVSNRMGLTNSLNPEITEKQLCQKIPRRLWTQSQHILFTLGREVCTAKNPKCDTDCPITNICKFYALLATDSKLRDKVFVDVAQPTR